MSEREIESIFFEIFYNSYPVCDLTVKISAFLMIEMNISKMFYEDEGVLCDAPSLVLA